MKKLQSFRDVLLHSCGEIAIDPQKTAIFAERGQVVPGGAAGDGFEYRYQITAIVQDFAGDVDAVSLAIVRWMRAELPGVLKNPERAERAFRFEVEMITSELVDLQIEVDVEEPVAIDAAGNITHPPAPGEPDLLDAFWLPPTI
jgi:hypothetical protein